jgi:glucose-6-phosphate 1-epimerase
LSSTIVIINRTGWLINNPRQVFGTAPTHPQTKDLPQHGFARTSRWEFLGKSTSESIAGKAASEPTVKLDFGLSSGSEGLDHKAHAHWPFRFNLIYSVTLNPESLTTSIVATNDGAEPFECQVLMHTYLRVNVTIPPRPPSLPQHLSLREQHH